MNPWIMPLLAASAVGVALFGFAFVASPYDCEWGFDAYFWVGAGALVVLLALPVLVQTTLLPWQRLLLSLGLGGAGVLVWIAGLFASNMRIICRLF